MIHLNKVSAKGASLVYSNPKKYHIKKTLTDIFAILVKDNIKRVQLSVESNFVIALVLHCYRL